MNQVGEVQYSEAKQAPAVAPRVLHVTSRADFTGGALYAFNLMEGLGQEVENFVACPADGPLTPRLAALVGDSHLLPIPERAFGVGALRRFVGFLKQNRIEILHSHGKGSGVYTRLAALLTGIPAVHTFHGLHFRQYSRLGQRAYWAYERSMSSLSRTLIAGTESEKTIAVEQGFAPADKVMVIRTGLKEIPTLQTWSAGGPVNVVHFSRFNMQKNFDAMIELGEAAKASGLGGKLRFLVIGDGPHRAGYQDRVTNAELDEFFEFLGTVPDVASIMTRCKALVSTSLWEGLPVAPLEAGQAGLYLALSRIPAHEDLVLTEDGAMLFTLGDRAAYTAAVERMAQLHSRTVGDAEQAAALLNTFNFDAMTRRHVELYRGIAGSRGSREVKPR